MHYISVSGHSIILKSNTLAHGVHRFKIDVQLDSHRMTAPRYESVRSF